jgi:hypothetical protein
VKKTELEFCRKCGVEFLHGLEKVCASCGSEWSTEDYEVLSEAVLDQIAESGKCVVCLEELNESDEEYWDYWNDFDSPSWLSIDYVWCTECILARFSKENPDYQLDGKKPGTFRLWEPDTFLIWKEALGSGIDLGPKLLDIEESNAIRRLRDCAVSFEDIIKWLASDCPIDEAEQWPSSFDAFEDAMAWRKAGFKIDEDDIDGWLEWGCGAEDAAQFVQQGEKLAPRMGWKEIGIGIADAFYFERHDFTYYEHFTARHFIGTWLPTDFSPSKIVELRDGLLREHAQLEMFHQANLSRLKQEDRTEFFWGWLPRMFEVLKSVGLPITVENLKKYWGLSSKEILNVIDSGGKPGVAADVVRQGGSVSKLGIIERLLESGMDTAAATLLTQQGFLLKHLKRVEKKGDTLRSLGWLTQLFEADLGVKVDEALEWLDVEATVSQCKMWRQKDFSPEEAAKWSNEGFQPELAGRWRDAGVASPVTAKRRRDAGLNP